ncbi:MAG: electron transfer flavoprotein subunit alpha [Verrucomicrobiota bacterium]
MEKILVLIHTETDGSLGKAALESLTAANNLVSSLPGSSLSVGVVGGNVQPAAAQLGGLGAAQILGVAGADFEQSRYASDAAAVETLCQTVQPTIVVAVGTSRWARVLPGTASRLKGRAETHVTQVGVSDGKITVTRWYYRQRMEALLQRAQRPWFIVLDAGCYPAFKSDGSAVSIQPVAVALPDACKRTQVTGIQAPPADEQTIRPDAELLFVTGAGWTKKQADGQPHVKDAETHILGFLKLTRASLGSSKSLVDLSGEGQQVLSFLTHLNQIGQTGSTPRHAKGLATCCHGEEPHTVGWRFINERRAINLDANCGWARGKADVLYVTDAFAVMKKVNEMLATKPASD